MRTISIGGEEFEIDCEDQHCVCCHFKFLGNCLRFKTKENANRALRYDWKKKLSKRLPECLAAEVKEDAK